MGSLLSGPLLLPPLPLKHEMSAFQNTAVTFLKTVTEGSGSAAHTEYVFTVRYPTDNIEVQFDWEVTHSALNFAAL